MANRRSSVAPRESPWEAIQPYLGFVQTLARRYRWAESTLGSEDAEDLFQEFFSDRLPRIVGRLSNLEPQYREAYLEVSFRNFVKSHLRRAARYKRALDAISREAPEPAGETVPSVDAATLLGERDVPALVVEFFTRGTSIRSLADKFGVSRHQARKMVVDGALLLVLRGTVRGGLSDRQRAVGRALLLEGAKLEEAATALGITENEARRALAAARDWIGKQLR